MGCFPRHPMSWGHLISVLAHVLVGGWGTELSLADIGFVEVKYETVFWDAAIVIHITFYGMQSVQGVGVGC